MRRALEQWANDLTSTNMSAQSSASVLSRDVGLIGARATPAWCGVSGMDQGECPNLQTCIAKCRCAPGPPSAPI